jgi:hypothetical protein
MRLSRDDRRYLTFLAMIILLMIAGMAVFIHYQEKERNTQQYVVVRNHFGAPILCWRGTHIFYRSSGEVEFRDLRGVIVNTPTATTSTSAEPALLGIEPSRCAGGVYSRPE